MIGQGWLILALLLAIAPAIATGSMILKQAVNVPYWDQWGIAVLLLKQNEGDLSFQDLFAQHNEHRIFFPQLIFLALASLTHWNVKYEMLLIFLFGCIASLSIHLLFKLTVTRNRVFVFWLTFFANFLIFSPVQYECWLWGFQITFLMPIVCLVVALLITQLKVSLWFKLLSCIVLATVSTFSVANGVLCWVVLLPVLLVAAEGVKRKTLFLAVIPIWLVCALLNLIAYFSGYKSSPSSYASAKGSVVLSYPFAFLGSPLGVKHPTLALTMGCILVSLYVFACLYILFRQRRLLKHSAVWLGLGVYPILSAVIGTLARSGSGVEQALASRYTTISVYLVIAVVALLAIVSRDIQENPFRVLDRLGQQTGGDILKNSLICLITICLTLNFVSAIEISSLVATLQRDRLFSKTCLTFIRFDPSNCIAQSLNPGPPRLIKRLARGMNAMGYVSPPLVEARNIAKIAPATALEPAAYGEFASLALANSTTYVATGWAALPQYQKPADSVLLTYQNAAKNPVLFAIASVRDSKPDVALALKDDRYQNTGWTAVFSIEQLPQKMQEVVVEAWAFDTERSQAYRVAKQHLLKKS